jgi:hypothetical protein
MRHLYLFTHSRTKTNQIVRRIAILTHIPILTTLILILIPTHG